MYYCCALFCLSESEVKKSISFYSIRCLRYHRYTSSWSEKSGFLFCLLVDFARRCVDPSNINRVCFHADNKECSRSIEHVSEIELSRKTVEIAELFTTFALTNYSRVISVLSEDRVKQKNFDNRVGPIEESLSEQRPIVVACRKSLTKRGRRKAE